jgi:cytochrome c-type biogenesis protein CcmE
MKPKQQRLIFITASVVCLCISAIITLRAFRDNLVFFYSPTDLQTHTIEPDRVIRVGGLVETGSITHNNDESLTFIISDGNAKVSIHFKGITPNLFREGQGIVAEGVMNRSNTMEAKSILAKHDEKYMPREVVDALKRNGRWKGEVAQ